VGKRPFRDAVPFARAPDRGGFAAHSLGYGLAAPHITKDMPNDGELVDLFAENLSGTPRCGSASWWTTPRVCTGR